MPDFKVFKQAVNAQFDMMSASELFRVDCSKDELWDTYLNNFEPGTNPVYKECTEHDCQCCKQFIRAAGDCVSIVNNKLVSIWDVQVGGRYQPVADALSAYVKSKKIVGSFFHFEKNVGTDYNHQLLESGKTKQWSHFHYQLPSKFVKGNYEVGELSRFDAFSDNLHFFSDHQVTCTKCRYTRLKRRAWIRAETWPGGLRYTEEEARVRALEYAGN